MNKRIESGDVVFIHWLDGKMQGTVLSVPQATGDLWCFEDSNGNIHAVNPNCTSFLEIVKLANTPSGGR